MVSRCKGFGSLGFEKSQTVTDSWSAAHKTPSAASVCVTLPPVVRRFCRVGALGSLRSKMATPRLPLLTNT